jgi:hypothetical protein
VAAPAVLQAEHRLTASGSLFNSSLSNLAGAVNTCFGFVGDRLRSSASRIPHFDQNLKGLPKRRPFSVHPEYTMDSILGATDRRRAAALPGGPSASSAAAALSTPTMITTELEAWRCAG